jgi:hypothetical protein
MEDALAGRDKLRRVGLGPRIERQWTWKSQRLHSRIEPTRRLLGYRYALDEVNLWRPQLLWVVAGRVGVIAVCDHKRDSSDCCYTER